MERGRSIDYWGVAAPALERTFYGTPLLRRYLLEEASGSPVDEDPGPNWAENFVVQQYLAEHVPLRECLSLCCGFGELERLLSERGVFEECLGVDISEGALAGARSAAEAAGLKNIKYLQMDLNHGTFAPQSFDLVWASGALHHIDRLEHVVKQSHAALRPGGWFVANEYVGPARQDFPPRQRELINALLHLIPERLRYAREDRFLPPSLRHRPRGVGSLYLMTRRLRLRRDFDFGKVWDHDHRHFELIDPTEGVRANEIVPTIQNIFGEVAIHAYNGSLLPYVLERRFFELYDPEQDQALLDLLIEAERTLTSLGEVTPDHAIVVVRKGEARRVPG
ncbi:MAG TPA: class I SAM-dependent methyltransferase [Gaiellaceae bacterium]|nr:class I SAM-dependent methyltransferase [Gaiellaceae bacterium]